MKVRQTESLIYKYFSSKPESVQEFFYIIFKSFTTGSNFKNENNQSKYDTKRGHKQSQWPWGISNHIYKYKMRAQHNIYWN